MEKKKHFYLEGITDREKYIMEMVKFFKNDYSVDCGYSRQDLITVMVNCMANLHEKIFELEDNNKFLQEHLDKIINKVEV